MIVRKYQPHIGKMQGRVGRILLGLFAVLFSLFLIFGTGVQGTTATFAAVEYTDYEKSPIEEDLRTLGDELLNMVQYPKDPSGQHRLMDNIGFMEYAYSTNAILTSYYGVYFYVYNPTEKVVSEREGANVVNMATAYGADGEPSSYENVSIRLLSATANNRFLKFGIVNKSGLYDRVRAYAGAHGGERRYDIAGIQLWFKGDQNATDANTVRDKLSYTYICTGFCAGCSPDGSEESTLQIKNEQLETVKLDIKKTFYRSQSSNKGVGHQNQLDTVYFTVPQKFFDKYGKLQRIKAEWWEYRTKHILVTQDQQFYNKNLKYVGVDVNTVEDSAARQIASFRFHPTGIPILSSSGYYEVIWGKGDHGVDTTMISEVPFMFLTEINPETEEPYKIKNYDPNVDLVTIGGISTERVEDYIFNYDKSFRTGTLTIKDKAISADLFESDIDSDRKIDNEQGKVQYGYSYYDFDIDADTKSLFSWNDSKQTWSQGGYSFWEAILGIGRNDEHDREFAPIYIVKDEDFSVGENHKIAENLMIQVSDVEDLRKEFYKADSQLVLFRFAVGDYYTISQYIDSYVGDYYMAQENVFLNFDIIQLTFNDKGHMKVIPVVASPIDIIDPITPGPKEDIAEKNFWRLVYWLCGIAGGVIVIGVVVGIIKAKTGGIL